MKIKEKREGVIRVIEDKDIPTEDDMTVVDPDKLAGKWRRKRKKLRECYGSFGHT